MIGRLTWDSCGKFEPRDISSSIAGVLIKKKWRIFNQNINTKSPIRDWSFKEWPWNAKGACLSFLISLPRVRQSERFNGVHARQVSPLFCSGSYSTCSWYVSWLFVVHCAILWFFILILIQNSACCTRCTLSPRAEMGLTLLICHVDF